MAEMEKLEEEERRKEALEGSFSLLALSTFTIQKTSICAHVRVVCVCVFVRACVCVFICTRCVHTCVRVLASVCVYICVRACVLSYSHIYLVLLLESQVIFLLILNIALSPLGHICDIISYDIIRNVICKFKNTLFS